MQFFVWSVRQRSSTAVDVIDYLVLDFTLAVGENLTDQIINGRFFGSDVTFTVSLSLSCFTNFYGPDCSTYCHPANSSEMGHYTCLSDGSKQCLPGYQNEATYCTSCVPAVGCRKSNHHHLAPIRVWYVYILRPQLSLLPQTQSMGIVMLQESVSVYQAMGETSVIKV